MADQLRWDYLSCYGHPHLKTPNIDNLAKKAYETLKIHFNNNYSDIISKFYGVQISKIISNENNKSLSVATEPYCLISLPINNNINNIYDCLDEYCKYELMSGDNAWYNDKTNNFNTVSL